MPSDYAEHREHRVRFTLDITTYGPAPIHEDDVRSVLVQHALNAGDYVAVTRFPPAIVDAVRRFPPTVAEPALVGMDRLDLQTLARRVERLEADRARMLTTLRTIIDTQHIHRDTVAVLDDRVRDLEAHRG